MLIFVLVGVALFAWGFIVGFVGPKLGTALAVLAVVLWFVLLAIMQNGGGLSDAEADHLTAAMAIGLVTFFTGSSIGERAAARRRGDGR